MTETIPDPEVILQLAAIFNRNGYVRWPNWNRRATEASDYKKGFEVRLVADSDEELLTIQRLLTTAGFTPGRPFRKSKQWRVPLYGRQEVIRFLLLMDWEPETIREFSDRYSW